jgi:hypothetical protein
MSNDDYLPSGDEELDVWALSFFDTLKANYTLWGLPDPTTSIGIPVNSFHKALEAAHGEYRGPRLTKVKNDARDVLKRTIRDYVMGNITYNKAITDAMKIALGLRPHDKNRTPHPAPREFVEFGLKGDGPMTVRLDFKVQGSANRRRPRGCNGAVVYYAIGAAPVTSQEELRDGGLATRTPHRLTFSSGDRGKYLSVSLCWQNNNGLKGNWSDVQNIVIP